MRELIFLKVQLGLIFLDNTITLGLNFFSVKMPRIPRSEVFKHAEEGSVHRLERSLAMRDAVVSNQMTLRQTKLQSHLYTDKSPFIKISRMKVNITLSKNYDSTLFLLKKRKICFKNT